MAPGTCGWGRTLGVPPGDTQCLSASCCADRPGPRRAVTGSLGRRQEHTATLGSVGSGGLPMPRKPTGTLLHWAAPCPRGSRSRETGLRVSTGGGLAPRGSALHPRGLAPVSTGSSPCPSAQVCQEEEAIGLQNAFLVTEPSPSTAAAPRPGSGGPQDRPVPTAPALQAPRPAPRPRCHPPRGCLRESSPKWTPPPDVAETAGSVPAAGPRLPCSGLAPAPLAPASQASLGSALPSHQRPEQATRLHPAARTDDPALVLPCLRLSGTYEDPSPRARPSLRSVAGSSGLFRHSSPPPSTAPPPCLLGAAPDSRPLPQASPWSLPSSQCP